MQNKIEMGPTTNPYYLFSKSRKPRQNVRNEEQMKEKLRRLKDVMAGCEGGVSSAGPRDTLYAAVHQLKHNREMSHRYTNAAPRSHQANFTAGYLDSVRDINRVLLQSSVMEPKTRSIFSDYMTQNSCEYNDGIGQQRQQFNVSYVAPQTYNTNPTPYTYWKVW